MSKNIICEKRRAFICEYAHMTICKNISVGAVNMRRLDWHVCVDWRQVVFDDLIAFETKIIVLLRVPDDRLRALCS